MKRSNRAKLRGQMTILALVFILLTIILALNFVGPIVSTINATKVGGQITPLAVTMMDLIPALMVILVIVAMFQYATPSREQIR